MAVLVTGNIRAVIAPGVVLLTLQPLLYSRFAFSVVNIETVVIVKCKGYSLSLINSFHLVDKIVVRLTGQKPERINALPCETCPGFEIELSFHGSPRLDGVARKLDEQRVPEFGMSTIYAVECVKVQLCLSTDIYNRYRGLLKACAFRFYSQHGVQIRYNEDDTRVRTHVRVGLVSRNRDALVAAKAALDRVLISNLALPPSQPPMPSNQTYRIVLSKNKDYIQATQNGGIERAHALLGTSVVHLDTASEPPAIVVKGDTATLRKVQQCLFPDENHAQRSKAKCTICWDEAEDYVKVEGCDDLACKECFISYCTIGRDNKFPLRCFQEKCESLLQLREIWPTLGQAAFQRLASEAVEHYFKQRPNEFVKCPGPGCKSYFPASSNETHPCASCFTISCQRCKAEYHFGETCAQYKERTADNMEKLQQWMERKGAKRCPRCEGIVQKDLGCDNVQCPLCKVNFCWACLTVCESHYAVYSHQINEHGSYFGNQREAEDNLRQLFGPGMPAEFLNAQLGHPRR